MRLSFAEPIAEVAAAAVALRTLRREVMAAHGWSLRELYRTLDEPGDNPLRTAHARLDTAVRAAYGMPKNAEERRRTPTRSPTSSPSTSRSPQRKKSGNPSPRPDSRSPRRSTPHSSRRIASKLHPNEEAEEGPDGKAPGLG